MTLESELKKIYLTKGKNEAIKLYMAQTGCSWNEAESYIHEFEIQKGIIIPDGKGGFKRPKTAWSGKLIFNLSCMLFTFFMFILCICKACSDWNRSSTEKYEYDDEYWRSVQREKTLRDNGMDKTANRERQERQNRLRRKQGSSTYNGSEQQKKDLDAIDEYMKKHPDF